MIRVEQNGLHWLEFELLSECSEITHGSFTRHGGFSQGAFSSLNLGKVGDSSIDIQRNLQKVTEALSIPYLFSGKQCHGKTIAAVNPSTIHTLPACDGLTTKSPDIALMILQADCQAAIFYDPINRALANVHCGWRGSVQNIYHETIRHMRDLYHSKPENLLVCISPSLGPQNSEFVHYRTELPESFWDFQIKPTYFNFWAISEWQLAQAGILPHHIQIAKIDTYANNDDFFSYRRHKQCGLQATICCLNA